MNSLCRNNRCLEGIEISYDILFEDKIKRGKIMSMLKKNCRFYGLPSLTFRNTGKTVRYAYCSLYCDWESRMGAGDLCPDDCEGYLPTNVEVRGSEMRPRSNRRKMIVGERFI